MQDRTCTHELANRTHCWSAYCDQCYYRAGACRHIRRLRQDSLKKDMLLTIKDELRAPPLNVQNVDILFERPRLQVTAEGQISYENRDYLFSAQAEGEVVYNRDDGVFYIESASENIDFSKFEPFDDDADNFSDIITKLLKPGPQALVKKRLSTISIYRLGDGLVDDVTKQMLSEKAIEVSTASVVIHRSLYRPAKAFVGWAFGSVWGLIVIAAVVMAIVIGVVIAFRILGISMKSMLNSIWSSD